MNILLKSSANRLSLTFFDSGLVVIGGEISPKVEMVFFFVVATRLSCETMCTVTAKQQNCRFLVLKRKIQNVAASFAHFTVVETGCFIR